MKKALLIALLALVVLFLAIQAVPYGHDHTNPHVRAEPSWDNVGTRDLAVRACFDCHSNETVWPWYSNVAPVSWLVQRSVESGRRKLNYSKWDLPQEEPSESAEAVQKGKMPPTTYAWLHPRARLSSAERAELVRGLQATFGTKEGNGEGGDNEEDEDDD